MSIPSVAVASKKSRTVHELKIWPEFFEAWSQGRKRAEVRKNDRGYRVGDFVLLREYNPKKKKNRYTGRQLKTEILHIVMLAEVPGTHVKDGDFAVLSLAAQKPIRTSPSEL